MPGNRFRARRLGLIIIPVRSGDSDGYCWSYLGSVSLHAGLFTLEAGVHIRYAEAADVCAQTMKALCLSHEESTWERAQFLELVPEENKSVVVQVSDTMVTEESALKIKLQA